MGKEIRLSGRVCGWAITVTALPAGPDWSVTVLGGCAPHVGSVSLGEMRGGEVCLRTLLREGHMDQVVGDRFARRLAQETGAAVCVSCGIHYDGPSKADLAAIVACADEMLEQLCGTVGEIQ